MAQAATHAETDDSTQFGNELREDMLRDFLPGYKPAGYAEKADTLDRRYVLQMNAPLREFDGQAAKAYMARDEMAPDQQLVAIVCSNALPHRPRAVRVLKSSTHTNLPIVVGAGVADLPNGEQRYVIIYERPRGKSLTQILAEQQKPLPEGFIVEHILSPLVSAIRHCEERGFSIGRINPDNIFYAERLCLGDFLSEPCGYSQLFTYEPAERMQAHPAGKGEGSSAHDYYALGILLAWLKIGPGLFQDWPQEEMVSRLLREGAYIGLIGSRDLPDGVNDFLRGTLNDNKYERWGFSQARAWCNGRRFNLLAPAIPNAASRPFPMEGQEYANFRSLAQGMYRHWEQSALLLREGTLTKWIELSAKRKPLADSIIKAVSSLGGSTARSERQNNELVARCLTLIDPSAPLRLKQFAAHVDGLGPMIAEAFRSENQSLIQHGAEIIEQGLANIWADMQRRMRDEALAAEMSTALWNIDRERMLLRSNAFGFGMERCLYDLNPELPCQSRLLAGMHVTTLPQLLIALDRLSPKLAGGSDPVDRHIAAFIASKLSLTREIKGVEFKGMPELANHKTLAALAMLQHAQEKGGPNRLPGLAAWVVAGLSSVVDHFHSRSFRKQLAKGLAQIAPGGNLAMISEFLLQKEYFTQDNSGFELAVRQYHQMAYEMERLRDPRVQRMETANVGHNIARIISYVIFFTTLLFVLMPRFI